MTVAQTIIQIDRLFQLKHETIRCNALPLNFFKLSEAFDSFNRERTSQYSKIEEPSKVEVAPPLGAQGVELGYRSSGSGAPSLVPGDLIESEELSANMVKCLDLEEPFLVQNEYAAAHSIQLCKDFYGLKVVQSPCATDNHKAVTHWLINLVNLLFQLR